MKISAEKYIVTPELKTLSAYRAFAQKAVKNGAECLEYRFSGKLPRVEKAKIAVELKRICGKNKVFFFVRDEAPLAFYCRADGVCVESGMLDVLPIEVIRKIAVILERKKFLIGIALKNKAQNRKAQVLKPDFIREG
jgi:thiamine monophosphate synthase